LVQKSPSHDPCIIVCTWAQHQATSSWFFNFPLLGHGQMC
jgi:hypothetical protein